MDVQEAGEPFFLVEVHRSYVAYSVHLNIVYACFVTKLFTYLKRAVSLWCLQTQGSS